MKRVYPVIFTQTKEKKFLIEVPDLQILSEGKSLLDAIDMARDAIGLKIIVFEDNNIQVPDPCAIQNIKVSEGTFAKEGFGIISMVDVDCDVYRKRIDNKTVRRNVTLPNWLNQEAEEAHVNVSKILQEALINKLGIEK